MTKLRFEIGVFLLVTLGLLVVFSPRPIQREGGPGGLREGRLGAMRGRFEPSVLEAGSAFPEVGIHDAQGRSFHTKSLKGHFTVVVSGCLT